MQEKSVQIIDISKKLKELWDEELGKDRIRACLFNLVIVSQKAQQNEAYEKLIQSVIAKYPCRVIWIKEAIDNSTLKTEVKACALSENIFCEIIEIESGSAFQDRVSSLVLPHIVPDLPLHLLWTEDPSQNKTLFTLLAPRATKILLNPSTIENFSQYCSETLKLMDKFPGSVSDLNWGCIKPWRHLFAAIFNTQEALNCLLTAKTLKISYNATSLKDVQYIRSAYFQGWLASCCSWKFKKLEKDGKNHRIIYKAEDHDLEVILIPNTDSAYHLLPSGAIISCDLENGNSHYSFKRKADSPQVFWQYSDNSRCDLPYCQILPGITEGQELLEEIFYSSERKHYRNTLEIVSSIPWNSI